MRYSTPLPRTRSDGIVVAGGGLAAQRCVETLRRSGCERPIRMVCAERHRPYDRPPLSKEVLIGEQRDGPRCFQAADWYERHDIDLLLGLSAEGLVARERRLLLSDRTTLRYEKLLIATGSRPRKLAALDGFGNVSTLRTQEDARELADVLATGPRLAIVGAGFIGQEVAASARRLGATVTMVEAAPRPLAGILGDRLGDWFARLHREEGVEVLTRRTIAAVRGNGDIRALQLSDGGTVEADHVVVGIGVEPEVGWLAGSGVACERGIQVDPHGRTELEHVFAAGDAAATFDPVLGAHVSGSHWEAAGRQGARAAKLMLGLEPGPLPTTSFWTDQYGIRIQYLGHARLADEVSIDGDPDGRDFTATYTSAGRAVAALLVNRPRALPAARKSIEHERRPT
jgi:NADPH-dependent 2,4-dienoyl-CoA reductase/sulfur reductase-like enzyme